MQFIIIIIIILLLLFDTHKAAQIKYDTIKTLKNRHCTLHTLNICVLLKFVLSSSSILTEISMFEEEEDKDLCGSRYVAL